MNAKRECLEKLLAEGLVFLQLDPRVEGVDLPAHLRRQPVVGLNLSLNFRLELFEVNEEGVRASLSFQGVRHFCTLPWASIFMMGLAEGDGSYVFPESAPVEMRERLRAAVAGGHATPGPTDDAEIADDDKNTEGEEVEDEPPPPPVRGRPQLRLVK